MCGDYITPVKLIELLFILMNACAPYDWTDCTTTLEFIDGNRPFGNWQEGRIVFLGNIWEYKDCWGMSIWQHEWMHKRYGQFHMAGLGCMLR